MTEFTVNEGDCFAPNLVLMTPDTDGINGALETSIMLNVSASSVEGKGARE